jgi:hypothetical protein
MVRKKLHLLMYFDIIKIIRNKGNVGTKSRRHICFDKGERNHVEIQDN